jgi:predicted double-glycine peptidase
MYKFGSHFAATLAFFLLIVATPSAADSGQGRVQRHTIQELRNKYVVTQKLDYSCGAAALATLMSYYFREPMTEKEILDLLDLELAHLSEAERVKKKQFGFSLLDLKKVAERKGYKAAGFQLPVTKLSEIAAPVIVYVRPLGYHHFAVLRGVSGDRFYLADPKRGNLTMSLARFADEYGGVVFVLGKPGEEDITLYPAALGRPDDYAQPDREHVIHGIDRQIDSGIRSGTLRSR